MGKVRLVQLRNYLGNRLFRVAQKVSVDSLGGPTMRATLSAITPQLKPDELTVPLDNPYAEDLLGRKPIGEGLNRLVDYGAGTGVVLIDASWGNGKTTFLRMWIQQAQNDGKVVALVNAWDGDYRGRPLEYIATVLAEELERLIPRNAFTRLFNRIRQVWSFLTNSIARMLKVGTAATAPLDGGAAWTTAIAISELVTSLRNVKHGQATDVRRLKSLRKKLQRAATMLRNRRHQKIPIRFVIVIDELDRCRPDYAVQFMETIKHVFEVEHITFVIAANSNELAHAMRGAYGEDFDGEGYLERFFDIRLQLPEGNRKTFVTRVVEDASLAGNFGSELPRDEIDSSITGENVVAQLLQSSTLSLREIHKTLNHIRVMLLFYRSQLVPYVLSALVLATIRSVAREAYDALEHEDNASGAFDILFEELGNVNIQGDPLLEFVADVLYWCRQTAESELPDSHERGRDGDGVQLSADDALRTEFRSARRNMVNYRVVREIIEMTAPAKDSS